VMWRISVQENSDFIIELDKIFINNHLKDTSITEMWVVAYLNL